jgi:hypothetical protein
MPSLPDESAQDRYERLIQPYRKQVSDTPRLLSLLYDLDLLPEQISSSINAARMIAICELFKMLPVS